MSKKENSSSKPMGIPKNIPTKTGEGEIKGQVPRMRNPPPPPPKNKD